MTRRAPAAGLYGRGGKAVLDDQAPMVQGPVDGDLVARHVREFHKFPRQIIAEATVDELLAWHAAEHRHRDAPKRPSERHPAHAGHLRHRHDPASSAPVVLERALPAAVKGRVA